MTTITRTVNGRRVTTYAGESNKEFADRQRAKLQARRAGNEQLAQALQRARGTKQVEALTRIRGLKVSQPELFTEKGEKATSKIEVIDGKQFEVTEGFSRADLVKRKALKEADERETARLERLDKLDRGVSDRALSRLGVDLSKNEQPSTSEVLNIINRAGKGDFTGQRVQIGKFTSGDVSRKKEFLEVLEKPSKLRGKLERLSETQAIATQRAESKGKVVEATLRGGLGQGAIGVGLGVLDFVDLVKNPFRSVKETAKALSTPIKTVEALGEEFTRNPAGVVGRFYSFNKALGLTGKALKSNTIARTIAEENFIRNQPKKLQADIRAVLKANRAQEKVKPVKPQTIKKVSFEDVQNLNKAQQKALKTAIKKTDALTFGSKSGRVLSGGKTKLPNDIDLAVKDVNAFNKAFVEALSKAERKNVKISRQKIKDARTGKTLADVKPFERLRPDFNIITRRGKLPITGFSRDLSFIKDGSLRIPTLKKKLTEGILTTPTQKTIKVGSERLSFVSFGEQTTRKGLGTLSVLLEKNVNRVKDPKAYIESLKIQERSLRRKGGLLNNRKARIIRDSIEVLEKRFGKDKPLSKGKAGVSVKKQGSSTLGAFKYDKTKGLKSSKVPKTKSSASKIKKQVVKSKIPSKLPKSRKSLIPKSKIKSNIPKSKIPTSKLPIRVVSRFPSKISKPIVLSRLPSQSILKSRIPQSKLVSSKIPKSRISTLKTKKSKVSKAPPKIKIKKSKVKAKSKVLKQLPQSYFKTKYTPTLAGSGKRRKGEDKLRYYTGAEIRL